MPLRKNILNITNLVPTKSSHSMMHTSQNPLRHGRDRERERRGGRKKERNGTTLAVA
jgi:hypothetical protein